MLETWCQSATHEGKKPRPYMYNWRSYNQTGSKKYDNGRNERNEKIRKLQEGF